MPSSREFRVSGAKTFAAHRCEMVYVGYGYEVDAERYRYDNRFREKFSLLQWTVRGEGCFRADREYRLRAGQAFLVNSPSNTAYWLPAGGTWEFYWVLFVGDMARWHVEQLVAQHGHIFEGPLPQLVRETYDEAAAGKIPDRYTLCARMYQILMDLYRGGETTDDPIERALRMIYRCYAEPALAVPDLATAAGLSVHHFARLFRARTGQSPWEFVLRVRLERARDLLVSTQRPIKEIGQAVGFRDYSYFCRVFREHTGQSPNRTRQRAHRVVCLGTK